MSSSPPPLAEATPPPTPPDAEVARESDELCVVCCKSIVVYSIGVCGHCVCYECSTRMRVICRQHECPICRRNLPQVIFSKAKKQFADLKAPFSERFHGIQFMTRSIRDMYYRLLEQVCKECKLKFKNFLQLRDHMRVEHDLHYCDLCVKHLLIFSFERTYYTWDDLNTHRKHGDPDNTSHRGHPLCEFCNRRYMDNDHLFRHLRRDHLYCHLCDADGTYQYYSNYDELRTHFEEAHFLCHVGNCKWDMLTAVFRTEIDLKAHVSKVHGKELGRAGAKQARTLEVEFNFTRRNNQEPGNENIDSDGRDLRASHGGDGEPLFGPPRLVHAHVPLTPADFPSLTGALDEAAALPAARTATASVTVSSAPRPRLYADEFPTLSGAPAPPPPSATGAVPRTPRMSLTSATRFNSNRGLAMIRQTFPSLWENDASNNNPPRSGTSVVKLTVQQRPAETSRSPREIPTSTSIQVRPRSMNAEAFPALGGTASTSNNNAPATRQWVVPKAKKQPEPKPSKVAKPPVLPPSSLAEFPSLEPPRKTEKKSSSVTVPIRDNGRPESSNHFAAPSSSNTKSGKKTNESSSKSKNKESKNTPSNSTSSNRDVETKKGNRGSLAMMTSTLQIGELVGCASGVGERGYQGNGGTGSWGKSDGGGSSLANNKGKGKGQAARVGGGKQSADVQKTSNGTGGGKAAARSVVANNNDGETANGGGGGGGASDNWPALGASSGRGGRSAVRPPPGFGNNDLTFTSSSGQSYSIGAPPGITTYAYYPPPNFHNRNTALIQRIVSALRTQQVVDEFKSMSLLYREGEYAAEDYYALCVSLLAADFDELFPELLVLLPNIQRQEALFRVYAADRRVRNIDTCIVCQQVILASELEHHLGWHYPHTTSA